MYFQRFRKGAIRAPGNDMSVAQTSVPSKLVETIIKNRLIKYIKGHFLPRKNQHGFCLASLLQFFDKFNKCIDKGNPIDIK